MKTSSTSTTILAQENQTVYQVKNKTFIVKPVFADKHKETLASRLIRLMKNDIA